MTMQQSFDAAALAIDSSDRRVGEGAIEARYEGKQE